MLQRIGSGSLPLGRLFEGHVNAIQLVLRYGHREQIALVARETLEGKIFGVWNADDAKNLRLIMIRDAIASRAERYWRRAQARSNGRLSPRPTNEVID